MKLTTLVLCGGILIVEALPCLSHAQGVPPAAKADSQRAVVRDTGLFLSDDDIVRVRRVLPGLADASQLGPRETTRYLATQSISSGRITQVLTNVTVAYTVIRFDEWMQELRPMLDTTKSSRYRELIAQSQRRLDSLTANYKRTLRGGRSALDVNVELIRKNLPEVETLLMHVQRLNAAAMPSHD
jgi:hypothetical protein